MSLPASPFSGLLEKSATFVPASLRGSTYAQGMSCSGGAARAEQNIYDSRPRSMQPRSTGFLHSQQRGPQAGFTLVEVLVAIALLATIGAIVFGSLVTTTQVVDAGRAHSAREQTMRRIFRLMADELSISTNSQTFPWLGVNGTQEGQPADTVAFLTITDGVGIVAAAPESETVRVVYTREGERLLRFTRRNLYGLTDESVDQMELATRVKAFNVRYFDGQARVWTDEWSTVTKKPKAMLLEVTFQPVAGDPWTVREWITIGAS